MLFLNGCNVVVIELRVVQFWSARSFDFEITRMILDRTALHSVQLPLLIVQFQRYERNVTMIQGIFIGQTEL